MLHGLYSIVIVIISANHVTSNIMISSAIWEGGGGGHVRIRMHSFLKISLKIACKSLEDD